jgi:hypothetical protein
MHGAARRSLDAQRRPHDLGLAAHRLARRRPRGRSAARRRRGPRERAASPVAAPPAPAAGRS